MQNMLAAVERAEGDTQHHGRLSGLQRLRERRRLQQVRLRPRVHSFLAEAKRGHQRQPESEQGGTGVSVKGKVHALQHNASLNGSSRRHVRKVRWTSSNRYGSEI